MNSAIAGTNSIDSADISLHRDIFLRTLIRELSGTLQDVVGLEEASGFISVVGRKMGEQIDREYKSALAIENLSRQQVTEVLVDLKKRIEGDFYLIEESEERLVFGNRTCPFEDKVSGRSSMCMMTSNVFGSIAAENLGYAKVELQQTLARGHSGCRVVVYLQATEEAEEAEGREYFRSVKASEF
ncbi:MAG: methanogen output domain 1-containing protein [Cyanobacteria bacterium P01_E01_bin.42]